MTLQIKKHDDDLIEVRVTGVFEATHQEEVIDPETALEAAEDLQQLAEEQGAKRAD